MRSLMKHFIRWVEELDEVKWPIEELDSEDPQLERAKTPPDEVLYLRAKISETRKKIREHIKNGINICTHDFVEEEKAERQVAMMGLYEKFADQFEGENFRIKIRKPMIFKAFVKFIINRNEHVNQ